MTKYKTRPGVVLTKICGEYLLIAAKASQSYCPYVTQLNETSAFLWNQLKEGQTLISLLDAVNAEYEADDPDIIQSAVQDFIREMQELGYLITEESESEE